MTGRPTQDRQVAAIVEAVRTASALLDTVLQLMGASGEEGGHGRAALPLPRPLPGEPMAIASECRPLHPDVVRGAVTMVASLGSRSGAGRVAAALRGSQGRRTLGADGPRTMREWGLLSTWRTPHVQDLLDALVRADVLERLSGPYPRLALTDIGIAILRGHDMVEINDPRPVRIERPRNVAVASDPDQLTAAELERFNRLRAWRLDHARAQRVPAYVIFPDRTLLDLACRSPRDNHDLLDVVGIGRTKAAMYGAELLELLRSLSPGAVNTHSENDTGGVDVGRLCEFDHGPAAHDDS